MPTIGQVLANERVRQKLDLEQVAAVTRINARLLKAIELDDFEQLPGWVFARNFVRQYAQFLGLDADKVASQFEREQAPVEATAPVHHHASEFSLNLPALADVFGNSTLTSFLTFVLTIGLCAGGVWIFNHRGAAPVVKAAVVARPAAVEKPVNPANVHVVVAASETCWTRITADGKVLFAGILNAGETREVDAASVVDLRAGSAGALNVKLNGNDIPPLGPKGQIRSVTLTASGAQVRTPIPEPLSEPL